MALFAVTFRLQKDEDDEEEYEGRYKRLTGAIENEAIGNFWKEPSSFYLLVSSKGSVKLKADILKAAKINSDDVLLVINLSQTKGHASHGIANLPLFIKLMKQRQLK